MWKSVLVAATVTLAALAYETDGQCEEPPNVDGIKQNLQTLIRDNYLSYMSFLNIQSTLEKAKSQLNETFFTSARPEENSKVLVTRLYGESRCKKRHHFRPNQNGTTNEVSSCPWHYVLEVDENRTPSALLKAKCTCRNCLIPTDYGYKRDPGSSQEYCEEVKYYMPVIRRYCETGIYRYFVDIENIPVGCTCQRCNRNEKHGNNNSEKTSPWAHMSKVQLK